MRSVKFLMNTVETDFLFLESRPFFCVIFGRSGCVDGISLGDDVMMMKVASA